MEGSKTIIFPYYVDFVHHKEYFKKMWNYLQTLPYFKGPVIFSTPNNILYDFSEAVGAGTQFDGYYYEKPVFDNDHIDDGAVTHEEDPPLLTYHEVGYVKFLLPNFFFEKLTKIGNRLTQFFNVIPELVSDWPKLVTVMFS